MDKKIPSKTSIASKDSLCPSLSEDNDDGDFLTPPKSQADDLKKKGDMLKDSSGDLVGNQVDKDQKDSSAEESVETLAPPSREISVNSKTNKHSDQKYTPKDLVEIILEQVPVKSLCRFKLTCKNWSTLFTQQRFIYKQLQASQRRLFLHVRGSEVWQLDLESLTYSRIQDFGEEISSISHCDGLVVFSASCFEPLTKTLSRKIAIWNCSEGVCAWIPRTGLSFYDFYTLGRDSKKSYRVLRFTHGRHDQGDFEPEAELYDLETHHWKTVEIEDDDWITVGNGNFAVVSIEMRSYWVAATEEGLYFVQSFDFGEECFGAIHLPTSVALPQELDYEKTVVLSPMGDQKLSLLYQQADKTEIWVTQVGDVVNWEKFMVLSAHPLIPKNASYLIMQKRISVFCEEVNGTSAKIKLRQIAHASFEETEIAQYQCDRSTRTRSCVYTESLVPVP